MEAGVPSSDPDHVEDLSQPTIAERADTCHDSLHNCLDRLYSYQEGASRWSRLRDLIGRFNIWTSNMGVFASLHASLDYRLRDLTEVKELILEHLCNIKDRLDQLYHLLEGPQNACLDPIQNADFDPHEELDSILRSISTSIDWLHRLANMIRRASSSRQNEKASAFVLKDEQGQDTTPVLQKVFRRLIKQDFPNIADEFCERLVLTMLLRRRRILYRRSRQTKLPPRSLEPMRKPTHLTAASAPAGPEDKPFELPEAPLSPALAPSGMASTQRTATTVEPQNYLKVKSTPSNISGAKTITMTSSGKDMIPPPPRVDDNAIDFICPFCSLILPAKDARDRGRRHIWASHVKKDIEPYVCHFFPCAYGNDTFSASADWISHIRQTHCMRWHCTTKTHGPQTFMSMEDYITHMTVQHPGKFEEAQLHFLAANSQRPLRTIFKSCPLCGENDVGKETSLENHVAHHLQYLALLSLPLPEDVYDTQSIASAFKTDSPNQEQDMVAFSRTTTQTDWHLMPPATFAEGGGYLGGAALPANDEIPDVDEQKQCHTWERWRLIRATNSKLRLESIDQPIAEMEQRSDKRLAAFVVRFERNKLVHEHQHNKPVHEHNRPVRGHINVTRGSSWYCCACKLKGSFLSNPNSPISTTCEDSSCSHSRCASCTPASR